MLATAVTSLALLVAAVTPVNVLAQAYGESTYGDCNYSEGCDETTTPSTGGTDSDSGGDSSGGLSDTGENQRLFIYGGLILAGAGAIGYSLKRKRTYRLHN